MVQNLAKLNENFIFETRNNSVVILIIVKNFWVVIYQILVVNDHWLPVISNAGFQGQCQLFCIFLPYLLLLLPISWFFKNKKSILFIPSTQNSNILSTVKIWLLIGCYRLALVTSHFTVPPIPSHGDFQWLLAKKFHSHFTLKSLLWRLKFKKFLQFLYWSAHLSEK